MRLKEFFERLPRDGWDLTRMGRLRRFGCCPITATCAPGMAPQHFMAAASIGGLDEDTAILLANAADGGEDYIHHPDNLAELRRRLIDYCQPTGAAT